VVKAFLGCGHAGLCLGASVVNAVGSFPRSLAGARAWRVSRHASGTLSGGEYLFHLGEVGFSFILVKAVIPAKAGIQCEVRLVRAEQF